ncbi:DUF3566 domain-containing protein [Saccharothrix coeruleofusca]|uniref:DUF3566 domain-containing protein n=1 Tax=Saccharothrix coeruleofusca TaxID=33919 RepID=A0A918AIX5_9PSEU|nr:hypothetical protein GCM10010185_07190 [Saccharothrix coeruleofusca]
MITRPSAAGSTDNAEQPTVDTSAGEGREQAEAAAEKADGHSAAPPPWLRATSEVQHDEAPQGSGQQGNGQPGAGQPGEARYGEAQQVGPGDQVRGPEQRAEPAYPASDPDTVAVPRPVPPATAAQAAAQAAAGRTSVNLGAASGRPVASAAVRRPGRGPRRASLQIKRVDPWSVLKLALVLSVALFFVWLVAVGVLYGVLNGMGVWDKINNTANDLLQGNEPTGDPLISAGRVFGVAAIIGAVNIVLFTALATVGAFVYNVSADLAGGLEVTLSERE